MDDETKNKKSLEKLYKKITTDVNGKIEEDRSKYRINVVIFNSGNRQAVIRYKGKIVIEGISIHMKRGKNILSNKPQNFAQFNDTSKKSKEEFLNDFLIIDKKSFNGMTLVVDEYNNRKKDIEFFQREYIAGQKKAKLTIFDINNQESHQKEFDFRNALSEGEEESLKAFLKEEGKSYTP